MTRAESSPIPLACLGPKCRCSPKFWNQTTRDLHKDLSSPNIIHPPICSYVPSFVHASTFIKHLLCARYPPEWDLCIISSHRKDPWLRTMCIPVVTENSLPLPVPCPAVLHRFLGVLCPCKQKVSNLGSCVTRLGWGQPSFSKWFLFEDTSKKKTQWKAQFQTSPC